MKTIVGSVVAALAASACCLGPVLLSLIGAGTLGAAATKLAAYRPYLVGLTFALLGAAFYASYRPGRVACESGGCQPSSQRITRVVLWIAAILAVLLAAFPYYVNYLF